MLRHQFRGRRLLALLAAAVFAAGAFLAAPTGPAWACPVDGCPTPPPTHPPIDDDPPPPPIHIVIMGDSFTSGEGMGMGVYADWRHQSAYAPAMLAWMYLEMAKKPLLSSFTVNSGNLQLNWGTDHVDFVASSGAATRDILSPQIDNDTGQQRSAPQINPLNASTDLVYFGFGGNDAHYSDLFKTAIEGYFIGHAGVTPPGSQLPPPSWQDVQTQAVHDQVATMLANMSVVTTNVTNALNAVSARAPNARIVVTLYPPGLKQTGNASIPFITGRALDEMYPFGVAVNNAIRASVAQYQAAHPNGPKIVVFDPGTAGPGNSNVVAGHEVGQPQPYFNPLETNKAELMNGHTLHGLQESFHPNEFGGVAIGTALASFLHDQFSDLWPVAPFPTHVITSPQAYVDNPQNDADFEAWANANLDQICGGASPVCVANPPSGGSGGSLPDPYDGGYIAPGDPDAGLLTWLIDVWVSQQSGGGTPSSGGTSSGDAFDYYVMLYGHWVHMYTDPQGNVHQDPMADDFVPPPDKTVTPQDADPADNDDPGADDSGDNDPGADDPGTGNPDDPGAGDGSGDGSGDGGYGDGGSGDGGSGDGGGDGGGGGGGGGGGCDEEQMAAYHPGVITVRLAAQVLSTEPCDEPEEP